MLFRRKKREQSFAQIAAKYVLGKRTRKLSQKDLEITIDGYKFYFLDMPLEKDKKKGF